MCQDGMVDDGVRILEAMVTIHAMVLEGATKDGATKDGRLVPDGVPQRIGERGRIVGGVGRR